MGSLNGRSLTWSECLNVRDLGGLPTESGGRTAMRVVVRADDVRRLDSAGWESALAYDVRRIVDLRFPGEVPDETAVPAGVEIVPVSLFGSYDRPEHRFETALRDADDVAEVYARGYVHVLEHRAEQVAAAVSAVAAVGEGAVLVHCFAGKDRTGLVCALVLALADVSDEAIAADYAISEPSLRRLFAGWIAAAADDAELRLRNRLVQAPGEAMASVLAWLRSAGGAESFLRDAGVAPAALERLRQRLAPHAVSQRRMAT